MAFEMEGFCVVRGPDVLWGGCIENFNPPAGKFTGVIGGPPCQAFSSLAHLVRANGHQPKFGNLIPEFERCVAEAAPCWFLMENVRAAPLPIVTGFSAVAFLWNNAWCAGDDGMGQEQERLRRFTFGVDKSHPVDLRKWMEPATFLLPESVPTATSGRLDNRPEAKVQRRAVLGDSREIPVAIGGSGKLKRTRAIFGDGRKTRREERAKGTTRYKLADVCRLQGLPEDFLNDAPFTAAAKLKAIGNGVPLPMGRAVAKAVREATEDA